MSKLKNKKNKEMLRQIKKEQKLKEKEERKEKKAKKAKNREYAIVSYFFVAIFVSLIGYLVYFNVVESADFINSPYNTRQNTFAERVTRGKIVSESGETLAYTDVDGEGNETRVYPYGNIFAHVTGYTSNGKSGIESLMNFQLLTSHAGYLEQFMNSIRDEKNMGDTVVTTLDTSLQQVAYDALGDYRGAVVVMEPQTGKILAMVSKPDFDPNTLASNWDTLVNDESNSSLLNRATQGAYPPGSTFKIITALAYIREHGTIDGFSYLCEGSITEQGHTVNCFNSNAHGQEDLTSAFANSCNSAFARIGLDLDSSLFTSVSKDLLFNKKLPVDISYRKSSFSLDKDSGMPLVMQTSIGQGNTLMSPMHMALIVSAIANEGNLMNPYLVEEITNYNGDRVSLTKKSTYKQLMSEEEASMLMQLMESVVRQGTASQLSGEAYTAAGKTGSAEYDTAEGRGTHSWFVGVSNVEDPDIVVSVIAEGAGNGSDVAVPIAKQIFNAYYY